MLLPSIFMNLSFIELISYENVIFLKHTHKLKYRTLLFGNKFILYVLYLLALLFYGHFNISKKMSQTRSDNE